MTTEFLVFLMFFGLIVCIFLGFPIAFTLIGVSLTVGYLGVGRIAFILAGYQMNQIIEEWAYCAIPLFVFIGCILEKSGMADDAFGVLDQWTRKLQGGLGIATVLLCVLFASCIGILGASVSTIGLLTLAPMLDRGYDKKLAVGLVAAGGALGVLLPPSIVLILFAIIANSNIAAVFMGTVAPGLLLAFFYALYVFVLGQLKTGAVPDRSKSMTLANQYSLLQGIKELFPFVLLIFAILGAIFFGITSPTEAAGFGATASIIITILYRKCNLNVLMGASLTTVNVTAMIMFMALGAWMFTSMFFIIGGADIIRNIIAGLGLGANGTLAVFLLLVFVLGIFLDWLGVSMILVPLFLPVLVEFGFVSVQICVITLVLLQTSFLTPPFAYTIFYIMTIAPPGITIADAYRGVIPFIIIQVIVVIICILFPPIMTYLPEVLLKGW